MDVASAGGSAPQSGASSNTNGAASSSPNSTPTTTNGTSSATQLPIGQKPTTTYKPEPKTGGRDRGPDGKFVGLSDAELSATPPPKPAEPFRYKDKLNVYGKEEDIDLSQEELRAELQIARAARQQMREVKQERDKLRRIIESGSKNPELVLRDLGADPEAFAQKLIAEKARREMMSPEEREFHQTRAELEQLRAERKQYQEEQQRRAQQEHDNKIWEQAQPQFMEALKEYNVPEGEDVMELIAVTGLQFARANIDLPPKIVVAEAMKKLDRYTQRFVSTLPTRSLMTKLGPAKVQEIVRFAVEDFKASQTFEPKPAAPVQRAPSSEKKEQEYVDEQEYRRRLGI